MIAGMAELRARLLRMGRAVDAALEAALSEAAREAMEDARESAPVGEGIRREPRLADSFSHGAQGLTAEARVVNPHAAYVEFGTGRRGAQSGGRAPGGAYDGDWAGMAAQPYMYPAAQRARDGFAGRMASAALGAMTERGNEI